MQQWPDFDSNGDLPLGIYQATLPEVIAHFGTSTLQRRLVARRLAHIYALAHSTGQLARFIIFGSFVTAKLEPNDVDIFMLMEDTFDSNEVLAKRRSSLTIWPHRISKGPACFRSDGWLLLAEKRRHFNTGKSNETR